MDKTKLDDTVREIVQKLTGQLYEQIKDTEGDMIKQYELARKLTYVVLANQLSSRVFSLMSANYEALKRIMDE